MMDKREGFRAIYLLLLPPYIALLWVGSYDMGAPALWGIPFFYWYQLLWIPLGSLLLYSIYRVLERFQQKCEALLRPEPRQNNELERRKE